jgi:hypothetical protein
LQNSKEKKSQGKTTLNKEVMEIAKIWGEGEKDKVARKMIRFVQKETWKTLTFDTEKSCKMEKKVRLLSSGV